MILAERSFIIGPMKRKDEAKARDIFAATLRTVQEHGLVGLSMEAVARRAGVAAGTLYVYHESKEALLEALYLETKRALTEAVFRDEGLPVRPAFIAMCRAYLEYLAEHPAEIAFLEQMARSTLLSPRVRTVVEPGVRPLVELLERGKRELLLKDLDTRLMIAFLQAAVQELSSFAAALPRARRAAQHEQIAQLCWDALKA
jgi:TetR/AcrR family transcriptional regulator, repressor of fatR-cypB operon